MSVNLPPLPTTSDPAGLGAPPGASMGQRLIHSAPQNDVRAKKTRDLRGITIGFYNDRRRLPVLLGDFDAGGDIFDGDTCFGKRVPDFEQTLKRDFFIRLKFELTPRILFLVGSKIGFE